MIKKDILFLASQSVSRQNLLKEANISFKIVGHNGEEEKINFAGDFYNFVIAIAQEKMRHVVLGNEVVQGQKHCFIVTADTLVRIKGTGTILGKPKNLAHAKEMLTMMHNDVAEIVTGCCLQKRAHDGETVLNEVTWSTVAEVEFFVDELFYAEFFKQLPGALLACGASVIEQYGQNFLKSIKGSYSTVIGLPLFELRQELTKMQFRF